MKELGKISSVKFGIGGYQDVMIGLHIELRFRGGVSTCLSESVWDPEMIECTKSAKWTEEGRSGQLSDVMRSVSKYLKQAKKKDVMDLVGVPVEVETDGMMVKSWRILTEVL